MVAHLRAWIPADLPVLPRVRERLRSEITALHRPQGSAAIVEHETVINEPTQALQVVPCANGGAGEEVLFTGSLHLIDPVVMTTNRVTLFSGGTGPRSRHRPVRRRRI